VERSGAASESTRGEMCDRLAAVRAGLLPATEFKLILSRPARVWIASLLFVGIVREVTEQVIERDAQHLGVTF
jgi:hypothetical protein